MTDTDFGLLDLFAFPSLQRKIVVALTRNGPADAGTLAQTLGREPVEVQQALTLLVRQGRIRLSTGGQAEVVLGKTRRRTLPARLWPALLATNRLYSAQEIATLRAAIPILQFARAKLSEFADHGPGHALRVKSFAVQLGYIMGLTDTEQHLLRAAALFHDVGNVVDRGRHHIISQEAVEKLAALGKLPFSPTEAALVGRLCRWHRKEYEPGRRDKLRGEPVRTGLLASILRVADAMDIDHRRSDYTGHFSHVLEFFYPQELPFWTSLEEILGVRIRCTPDVNLQIFVHNYVEDNMQVNMLRKDLASTPLDWSVQEIIVEDGPPGAPTPQATAEKTQPALLAFPFDPHSLVMAALSRKHLLAAGYAVELLCYPDTADSSAWFWGEALSEIDPANFARLVVINDRPDPAANARRLKTIKAWQSAGCSFSLLNRHEANWSNLPALLQAGVELILGGDWAYFWGDAISPGDLVWGRIAALCTRDPTQSTVGLTAEEQAVTQGLLKAVYDSANRPANDVAGWAMLAEPILARIAADDQAYFAGQADDFMATYAAVEPDRIEGRALCFEQTFEGPLQLCFWALEAAIERYGRTPERGILFNKPYAVAAWPIRQALGRPNGDNVELVAISHWREEQAPPIRLLYPADLGPQPEGNESAIRVRLPADRAEAVIQALLDACNQAET